MRYHIVVAAAIVSAAFVGGVGPAGAVMSGNSLSHNALEATGSALDDLNGVAVEAAVRAQVRADLDANGNVAVDDRSGHGTDGVAAVADGGDPGHIPVGDDFGFNELSGVAAGTIVSWTWNDGGLVAFGADPGDPPHGFDDLGFNEPKCAAVFADSGSPGVPHVGGEEDPGDPPHGFDALGFNDLNGAAVVADGGDPGDPPAGPPRGFGDLGFNEPDGVAVVATGDPGDPPHGFDDVGFNEPNGAAVLADENPGDIHVGGGDPGDPPAGLS